MAVESNLIRFRWKYTPDKMLIRNCTKSLCQKLITILPRQTQNVLMLDWSCFELCYDTHSTFKVIVWCVKQGFLCIYPSHWNAINQKNGQLRHWTVLSEHLTLIFHFLQLAVPWICCSARFVTDWYCENVQENNENCTAGFANGFLVR